MFTLIQPTEIKQNSSLLTQLFQLRKRVFADQLGWDVPVKNDQERDAYDALNCTYLIWCSEDRKKLYGAVRLMPTTGPTLLHDVFYATHGRNPKLKDDQTFEGTRMCLDEKAIAKDFPALEPGKAFSMLFVALCEASLALGIKTLVSNFEACMSRIYRRAGLSLKLHGSADGYGKRPVYCASFEVSEKVLEEMRCKVGIEVPLFRASEQFEPLVFASQAQTRAPQVKPVRELVQ